MQDRLTVIEEIQDLPEPLIREVLDFVRFLKTKAVEGGHEPALLSETSLAKDWLRPEEEEAWHDL